MRNISKEGSLGDEVQRLHAMIVGWMRTRGLRDPLAGQCEGLGQTLTVPQVHALVALGSLGPLTMGVLARCCSVTEKTITGVADRLERAKLVQRVRDEADRRLIRVRLTRSGHGIFRRFDDQMQRRLFQLLSLLEEDERVALFRILEKLIGRLGEGKPGRAPGKECA